jgi:hypothetical protein
MASYEKNIYLFGYNQLPLIADEVSKCKNSSED